MTLLPTALESCRRQEALFQAAATVSWDLHTSIAHTEGSYNNIINGHTSRLYQSQRVIPLSERPRTYLMLLASLPVLVEMT